ncbi:MAG: TlpA family protein disulfide reductase [Opitutae bacterium]|nr:TlpA family protein disulfide reductase [Opitutae bacterium]
MKNSLLTPVRLVVAFSLLAVSASAQFNKDVRLRIGDPAPAIKVETWVRGAPVTQFEKGKVYVLDFWATWCGGCIMAFPHISAIAEKFGDRVSFSSIDTYEAIGDSGKKVDPVEKVKAFLKTEPAQKLTLSVAIDGGSNAMWDAWIKPLRRGGLPTTFVIDQEGRIAWVDVNLDNLEWALDQVLAGRWDRAKAAAIMQARDDIDDRVMELMRSMEGPPGQKPLTPEQRQMNQAIFSACEAFENKFPDRKDAVAFYKLCALLEIDRSKLGGMLEQMAADPLSRYLHMSDSAYLVALTKDLPPSAHAGAAKVLERGLLNPHPQPNTCGKNALTYKRLAAAYDMAGEPAKATAAIENALTLAGAEGAPAEQIAELKQMLEKFRSAAPRHE